jgi:hypothetical protein
MSPVRFGNQKPLKNKDTQENYYQPEYTNVEFMTNPDKNHQEFLKSIGRSWGPLDVPKIETPKKNISSSDTHTQRINQGSDGQHNMLPNNTGMRKDGRLSDVKGAVDLSKVDTDKKVKAQNSRYWSTHSKNPTLEKKLSKELLPSRKKVPVQVDDVLKPGKDDDTPDIHKGNKASVEEHKPHKSHNNHYDPKKQSHPSDKKGTHLNNLSNTEKTRKILDEVLELQNINYNERKDFIEDKRKYHDSRISEDRRKFDTNFDRNQVMIDNEKTPININVSCNQSKAPWWAKTPDLYQNRFDEKINDDKCYNNTLNYWYNQGFDGNNVNLMGRRWRSGYGYGPSMSSSMFYPETGRDSWFRSPANVLEERDENRRKQVIGAPYAPYQPYAKVNEENYYNFSDPARDNFNNYN